MSKLALYPWQTAQWQAMQSLLNISAGSILLVGATGLGTEKLATYYLAKLLCLQNEDVPCKSCKSCRLFMAGSHPDCLIIKPEGASNSISIHKIRELITFCQQTKQTSDYKTVLIVNAEKMNNAAQNALLKTLEEPQENTVITLTTALPTKLLPTIRSRCLIKPVPAADDNALDWLVNTTKRTQDEVNVLWQLAMKQPLLAQTYTEQQWLEKRKAFYDSLMAIINGACPLTQAASWEKVELQQLKKWLYFWLYDCIKLELGVDNSSYCNLDFKEKLKEVIQIITIAGLYQFYDECMTQFANADKVNVNVLLLLETIAIAWKKVTTRRATRND